MTIDRPMWIIRERRATLGRLATMALVIMAALVWGFSGSVWRDAL